MISFNFLHGAAVILCYLATLTLAEFDANGTQNLFVYFSQSSGHDANLTNLCTSTAVDVVILGFVRDFNGTAGYPTIDFGPWACNGTRSSNETDAPGLAVCEDFGQQVKQCQDLGKKVFVSIGGQTSNTSFDAGSDGRQAAKNAARSMWDLFGEGRKSLSIRPFGSDIVVDGFDIDHEVGSVVHQETFTSTLRSYLASASKPMYIPAAPTCVTTDPSIPRAVLALVDFVFIRFYNSAKCGLGTPGFDQSLQQWYESFVPDPHSVFPKAILGGLSFDNGNQGYVSHESFGDALRTARRPELICPCWPREKFGGAMLWDGPRGLANEVEPGLNYVDHVKNVMTEAY